MTEKYKQIIDVIHSKDIGDQADLEALAVEQIYESIHAQRLWELEFLDRVPEEWVNWHGARESILNSLRTNRAIDGNLVAAGISHFHKEVVMSVALTQPLTQGQLHFLEKRPDLSVRDKKEIKITQQTGSFSLSAQVLTENLR